MKTDPHKRLANLNRVMVFSLTLGGLLLDGFRFADLPCVFAVFLWLWMPQCIRREAQLLRWINKAHASANRRPAFFQFKTNRGLSHNRR